MIDDRIPRVRSALATAAVVRPTRHGRGAERRVVAGAATGAAAARRAA